MSKKVKNLIEKQFAADLAEVDGVAVINPRGIDGLKNNSMRRRLSDKGLRMRVVKNTLARRASASTKVKGFDSLLEGPSALVYGQGSISTIARALLEEKKANDGLELRGMFFDGEIYAGQDGVEQVSKLPTREEAISQLVALLLSPAGNLAGLFKSQAGKVASLIKAVEEKAAKAEPTAAAVTETAPDTGADAGAAASV